MIVTLYDSAGNEIQLKPGHAIVCGKESCQQVPIDEYEAKFVYRPPDGSNEVNMTAEWGSIWNVVFPTSYCKSVRLGPDGWTESL